LNEVVCFVYVLAFVVCVVRSYTIVCLFYSLADPPSKSKRLRMNSIIEENASTKQQQTSVTHATSTSSRRRSSRIANNKPYRREIVTSSSDDEVTERYFTRFSRASHTFVICILYWYLSC